MQASKYDALTQQSINRLKAHGQTLAELDPRNPPDVAPYVDSFAKVTQLVGQRLKSVETFEQAATHAREALVSKEAIVDRLAVEMSGRLKDLELLAAETAGITNKFRLGPLRERLTATVDSFNQIEIKRGMPEPMKGVKTDFPGLIKIFDDEKTGLFAIRLGIFQETRAAKSQFRKAKRVLFKDLRGKIEALDAANGDLRLDIVLQKRALGEAISLSGGPRSITGLTGDLTLDAKRLQTQLEALMHAELKAEIQPAREAVENRLQALVVFAGNLVNVLTEMGETSMASDATGILKAFQVVEQDVEIVAGEKAALLAANSALSTQISTIAGIVARDRELSQQRIDAVTAELVLATKKVNTQVSSSTWQIIAIGLMAIFGSIVINSLMIRSIVSRLRQALSVAKSVSTGHLVRVPPSRQKDEISDLLAALDTMVDMLDGSVAKIRNASTNVNQGSEGISRGNNELSQRTEQQASHLTQTASQMVQIKDDVNEGAVAAAKANDLAQSACNAASQGSEVVGKAVSTMRTIEEGAGQISKIISAIDSIAFRPTFSR